MKKRLFGLLLILVMLASANTLVFATPEDYPPIEPLSAIIIITNGLNDEEAPEL